MYNIIKEINRKVKYKEKMIMEQERKRYEPVVVSIFGITDDDLLNASGDPYGQDGYDDGAWTNA